MNVVNLGNLVNPVILGNLAVLVILEIVVNLVILILVKLGILVNLVNTLILAIMVKLVILVILLSIFQHNGLVNGFCHDTIVVNGFFNVFFTSQPLFSLVFNGLSHLNHLYCWFFNGFLPQYHCH